MDNKYYEEYHKNGAGIGGFVGGKKTPLNNADKALFVKGHLKGKILDAGCGSGFDANYFYEAGYSIEGADVSRTAIKTAKENFPDIDFFVHNFELSKLDRKYDTICCFEVIEHVFDYKTFIKNIGTSLEDGGTLIISTPNVFGLKSYMRLFLRDGTVFGVGTSDDSHIRFFSIDVLGKVLVESGFEIIKIKTFSAGRIPLPCGWGGNIVMIAKKMDRF